MRLARAAYLCLLVGAAGAAFSLPLGRIGFGLSLLLTVVHLVRVRRAPRLPPVSGWAGAFFLAAVFASLVGVNPPYALSQLDKLAWFIVIPLAATLACTPRRQEALLRAYALGTVVLGLRLCVRAVGVLRGAAAKDLTDYGWDAFLRGMQRAPQPGDFWWELMDHGDINDAQLLMVGLGVSVAFILYALRAGRRTRWWWATLAVQTLALILQFKRGSWGCAVLLVAGLVLVGAGWSRRWLGPPAGFLLRKWKAVLAVLVIAVGLVAALPAVRAGVAARAERVLTQAREARPGLRLTMWFVITPALIREHPLGVGWCALTYEMMAEAYPYVEVRKVLHSNVAQLLVDTGWLGLGIYLLWMARALGDGLVFARRAACRGLGQELQAVTLLAMLAGLVVNGLVECNLRKAGATLVYAFVMGAAAAGRQRLRRRACGTSRGASSAPAGERSARSP